MFAEDVGRNLKVALFKLLIVLGPSAFCIGLSLEPGTSLTELLN